MPRPQAAPSTSQFSCSVPPHIGKISHRQRCSYSRNYRQQPQCSAMTSLSLFISQPIAQALHNSMTLANDIRALATYSPERSDLFGSPCTSFSFTITMHPDQEANSSRRRISSASVEAAEQVRTERGHWMLCYPCDSSFDDRLGDLLPDCCY